MLYWFPVFSIGAARLERYDNRCETVELVRGAFHTRGENAIRAGWMAPMGTGTEVTPEVTAQLAFPPPLPGGKIRAWP